MYYYGQEMEAINPKECRRPVTEQAKARALYSQHFDRKRTSLGNEIICPPVMRNVAP